MNESSGLRAVRIAVVFAALASLFLATGVRAEDIVTVKVTGQGIDEQSAIKDGLRKAVEQGGQSEIASRSKTQDFALEYDVVLARSSGLVKDHKVLSKSERDGITTVNLECKVSKSLIDATWADVAIELKKLGRPKIMVIFKEVIHDLERPEGSREIVQRSSALGTTIMRRLTKLGFKLVSEGQIQAIMEKRKELAAAEDDVATLKQIAKDFGADIFIKGYARGSGPQRSETPAGTLYMWETDVTIEGFWTETGDMIFANSTAGTRGGSRVGGPPGATMALNKTGEKMAEASIYDLLEQWTRGTAGGVGDIIVEVRGLANIKNALTIKKGLETVQGVEEVRRAGAKDTVRYTVVTAMSAEEFVEHLVELSFEGFELEVEDQKMKTIICTCK